MPPEIRAFFELYREAFNRLDGDAVARLYCVPSGIVDDGGYTHLSNFEQIRANMVALCAQYRSNGYRAATYQPVAFLAQGDRFAIADVAWSIERVAALEPWRFNTTYNLMRVEEEWRVLLCTAYSEKKLSSKS